MAKRFTDTGKWKKQSFGDLSLKMKLVWIYLCDNCDHAGIWDANLKLLEFQVGEPVTRQEISVAFGDKAQWLGLSKLFIPSFIEFQYGALNPENRVHLSVISRLEKEGACKDLISPLEGAKDKEKEKDKDLLKKGESEGKKEILSIIDGIFKEYPNRPNQRKGDGVKSLIRQLRDRPEDADICRVAVQNYANYCRDSKKNVEHIMQFATWVGSLESPRWREWINVKSFSTAKPFTVPD